MPLTVNRSTIYEVQVLQQQQLEMQSAYANGIPGVLVSGMVWAIAGIAAQLHSDSYAMISLFVGGMLIHPTATGICSYCFDTRTASRENPLRLLSLEVTALLFVGLFVSYVVSMQSSTMFFSTLLLIVGARYLCFQSVYGLKFYWLLGGSLLSMAMVVMLVFNRLPSCWICYLGGAAEIIFAIYAFARMRVKTRISQTQTMKQINKSESQ